MKSKKRGPFTGRLLLVLLCLLLFTACGSGGGADSGEISPSGEEPSTEQPGDGENPPGLSAPQDKVLTPSSGEEIQAELLCAIRELRQPKVMDISSLSLEHPEMDLQNRYYAILYRQPELKYAYHLTVEYAQGQVTCQVDYMPYRTGQFPAGFTGAPVSSLEELIDVAAQNMGLEPVPVRITNTTLSPDVMNRALQQIGGGYLYCALSQDATQITYAAPAGMEMQQCLDALAEAGALADQVYARLVTDGMTQWEQAQVLYSHLTQTVRYDRRYYTDKASMPYQSQTALGALRDGVAICGGYANALNLLFTRAGIPCWNVAGNAYGETHMWNLAYLEGQWLWFDATADRGLSVEKGLRHFATQELDAQTYRWSDPAVELLTGRGN